METMEQTINKIKEGYWITGVDHPSMRAYIIFSLINLSDAKWQEYELLKEIGSRGETRGKYGFYQMICNERELIFDDLNLSKYIKSNKYPYDLTGWCLKNNTEAEYLYNIAIVMNKLRDEVYHDTNDKYLSSTHLKELRKVSKEALKVFMKNEHKNKEFIGYIEDFQRRREQQYTKLTKSKKECNVGA